MTVYYNENDRFAAAWLRELVKAGLIAPGDVDERSIIEVSPGDLRGYDQCHFFAGIGTWSYALRCAGWPDDRPVWTGSCPCQPLSVAGQQKGHADDRHLWPHFHDLIVERAPAMVLGEQVAGKSGREWLAAVRADLESDGYAVGAADLCAAGVGAPHIRQRLYWVAHADDTERRSEESTRHQRNGTPARRRQSYSDAWQRLHGQDWQTIAAEFCADAHGTAARMGRLRGYGNAIVVPLATEFIEAVMDVIHP